MSRLVYDNLADHVLDLVFPIFKGLAADRSIELEGKQLWSISGDNWQQVTFPAATTFSYWEKNIPIRGPLDSSCNSILLVSQSCKRFVLYQPALCLGVSIIDNVKWAYVRDMKLWSEEIAQEFSCKLAIFISASLEHSQSSWFEINRYENSKMTTASLISCSWAAAPPSCGASPACSASRISPCNNWRIGTIGAFEEMNVC